MWQSPEGHRAHTLQDSVYDTGSQTSTYLRPRQAAGANGMGNLTAAKGKRALPPPALRPRQIPGCRFKQEWASAGSLITSARGKLVRSQAFRKQRKERPTPGEQRVGGACDSSPTRSGPSRDRGPPPAPGAQTPQEVDPEDKSPPGPGRRAGQSGHEPDGDHRKSSLENPVAPPSCYQGE